MNHWYSNTIQNDVKKYKTKINILTALRNSNPRNKFYVRRGLLPHDFKNGLPQQNEVKCSSIYVDILTKLDERFQN